MRKPIGVIGGGNVGEALIAGVIQSGLFSPEEVRFFEPRIDRRDYLRAQRDPPARVAGAVVRRMGELPRRGPGRPRGDHIRYRPRMNRRSRSASVS